MAMAHTTARATQKKVRPEKSATRKVGQTDRQTDSRKKNGRILMLTHNISFHSSQCLTQHQLQQLPLPSLRQQPGNTTAVCT